MEPREITRQQAILATKLMVIIARLRVAFESGQAGTVSRHNPVNRNPATFQIGNWLDPEQAELKDGAQSRLLGAMRPFLHANLVMHCYEGDYWAEIRGDVSTRLFVAVIIVLSAKKEERNVFQRSFEILRA